jgi:hypothetical protein
MKISGKAPIQHDAGEQYQQEIPLGVGATTTI